MDWKLRHITEDIEEIRKNIRIIPICNFVFFLFFLAFSLTINYDRVILLFSTAILFFLIHYLYDWSSSSINVSFFILYLALVGIEYLIIGMPESGATFQLGKGILFNIVIFVFPIIYIGIRVGCALSILLLEYKKISLDKIRKKL